MTKLTCTNPSQNTAPDSNSAPTGVRRGSSTPCITGRAITHVRLEGNSRGIHALSAAPRV